MSVFDRLRTAFASEAPAESPDDAGATPAVVLADVDRGDLPGSTKIEASAHPSAPDGASDVDDPVLGVSTAPADVDPSTLPSASPPAHTPDPARSFDPWGRRTSTEAGSPGSLQRYVDNVLGPPYR